MGHMAKDCNGIGRSQDCRKCGKKNINEKNAKTIHYAQFVKIKGIS